MIKVTHLSVKNGEAHKLATELAALTGESLTAAVTLAHVNVLLVRSDGGISWPD